jgi:hypothetical protein
LPNGVAVDSAGNLYVADSYAWTIRKVTPVGTNWVVSTLAGSASDWGSADGTGSAARFNWPSGVAVDSAGNVYVADTDNNTIRKGGPVVVGVTITAQPQSQTVTVGSNVTFNVTATGTDPLSYQWQKDGSDIGGETNAMLTLNAVQMSDAGSYLVVVSNIVGSVTSANAVLTVVPASFQPWQLQYFNCTDCPQAAATADADGDGQNNLAEFLSGTDPTNGASAFRITGIEIEGEDIRVTWMMGSGKTNALQATAGGATGSYTTNTFTDIFIATNTVGSVTNYLDAGGATNFPACYYRVRLVP